jgi:RNA polymerase sigma-70 factor (ECF subfamily)
MNFTALELGAFSADDATLVARYVAGDDAAFAPLLARYQGPVFTTLTLIVRNRDLAEDLTQDTFVKAVKLLREGRYRDEGKFGAWIGRIAHNMGIDANRRSRKHLTFSLDVPLNPIDRPNTTLPSRVSFTADTTAASPETLAIRAESSDYLRRMIQELPVPQREVLLMRHYGDMSFQEIADSTGISVNTVLGRMRYALRNLRRRMVPATAGSTSLLVLALLTAAGAATTMAPSAAQSDCFTHVIPPFDSDDPNLYPGNAAPLRLQRPA